MHDHQNNFILVITDEVGGILTNGSQVMAQALLLELSKWFRLKIIVEQNGETPEGLIAEMIQLGTGEEGFDGTTELLRIQPLMVYNFGSTCFSSKITALFYSSGKRIPLINHFQLLLPEYARHEGHSQEEINELGLHSVIVAEQATYNIFPSFSELNRAVRLGWRLYEARNIVLKNAFVPVPESTPVATHEYSVCFMAAGRFSDYVKGGDLLYRAFSMYYCENPSAHLFVASDDSRFTEFLHGVPAHAWTYLGWLSRQQLHAKLKEADVLIVPSRYEPFGLIAVEAMAMGTPVIAMAVDGLAEIVHHGHTGWLCDPKDGSLGLKEAMQQAARSKTKLKAMGETSRTAVKEEFSLKKMAGEIRRIFDNTLAGIAEH